MPTGSRILTALSARRPDPPRTGVINASAAVAAHTILSPAQFNLNDTQYSNYTQTLTLRNNNRFPVTYQLSWTDASGIVTYNDVRGTLRSIDERGD